jgi:tRNA nucleotidyltransferase (CCA-adding enzyme)
MYFLTSRMPDKDTSAIQRLIPNRAFVEQWKNVEDHAKELGKRLSGKEAATPSQTWTLLMKSPPESIVFLDVITRQQAVANKIKNFLTKWPQYRQKIPVVIMQEMRITPELPDYGKLTDQMFLMMLDGKLRGEAEIRKFLQPYSPPEPVAPPTPARRGRARKAEAAKAKARAAAAGAEKGGAEVPKKPGNAEKGKAAGAPAAGPAAPPAPGKPAKAPVPGKAAKAAEKTPPAAKPKPKAKSKPTPKPRSAAHAKPKNKHTAKKAAKRR